MFRNRRFAMVNLQIHYTRGLNAGRGENSSANESMMVLSQPCSFACQVMGARGHSHQPPPRGYFHNDSIPHVIWWQMRESWERGSIDCDWIWMLVLIWNKTKLFSVCVVESWKSHDWIKPLTKRAGSPSALCGPNLQPSQFHRMNRIIVKIEKVKWPPGCLREICGTKS